VRSYLSSDLSTTSMWNSDFDGRIKETAEFIIIVTKLLAF
jgi:hypothetical protein